MSRISLETWSIYIWIVIGATGGTGCSGPHHLKPRREFFTNKVADTSNWQAKLGVEAAINPKGTGEIAWGESTQTEHPAITVEVQPGRFQKGLPLHFEWEYHTSSFSASTLMEFSTTNQLAHSGSYTLNRTGSTPDDLKVMVKAIFRKQGTLPRTKSSLPPRIRFFQDRRMRHLVMGLEARVGVEGSDYFQFPTAKKEGCELWMEMDVGTGKICQRTPGMSNAGVVKYELAGRKYVKSK